MSVFVSALHAKCRNSLLLSALHAQCPYYLVLYLYLPVRMCPGGACLCSAEEQAQAALHLEPAPETLEAQLVEREAARAAARLSLCSLF